jgi:hypothetical protein
MLQVSPAVLCIVLYVTLLRFEARAEMGSGALLQARGLLLLLKPSLCVAGTIDMRLCTALYSMMCQV